MAGTLNALGLNSMADGIGNKRDDSGTKTLLELVAAVGTAEKAKANVTFDDATSGYIEITGDVTITIPDTLTTPFEITHVYLREQGASGFTNTFGVDVITGYAFENGGDLIVKGYKVQASN